ncbi:MULTISPECIES: SGNH/GDSL hydrolase family protein [unclassified Caballeronia]|uniref:SGNH/GDSL hydrolase family protein n=1 Tax=unclassified Caballeronia TaxID=2646786 RepID=UPI00286200F0|nr:MULTISPECIES: SGNH/GDSL hydrolase family protein [unclassified Caballeronia]MDR5772767.1 SGNH/GDSL hydrolase family protein [Caballeronia sp. LZ002]MDR5848201.1 SGNH/GDSL hydrolase family protein [Caballeronia sp. LZ003]
MKFRIIASLCAAALAAQFAFAPQTLAAESADAAANEHWVSAWGTVLQSIPQLANLPPLYRAPEVGGRTVRQLIYPQLDGKRLRLRVSNLYGTEPLVIESMSVSSAVSGSSPAIRAGSAKPVAFGGHNAVTVPPGGQATSDPIAFDVTAFQPLAVSTFMGKDQKLVAWHRVSSQVNYVSSPGNHANDASADAFRTRFTQYAWLTNVSVEHPSAQTVVAIGDSITDGMRSTLNANRSWPDVLARQVAQKSGGQAAIVNAGISGNRLLSNSPCYGEALVSRFERDALRQPGVRAIIVLIGINDINFAAMPAHAGLDCDAPHTEVNADALVRGYQRLIAQAHQRGIKIYGATLTPAALPPEREAIRTAVNASIRSSHAFDGVIDFDQALRDPARPNVLQRRFDSGDHIHPSDAGYAAMAAAVPFDMVFGQAKAAH